jgi:hypothetical protein
MVAAVCSAASSRSRSISGDDDVEDEESGGARRRYYFITTSGTSALNELWQYRMNIKGNQILPIPEFSYEFILINCSAQVFCNGI